MLDAFIKGKDTEDVGCVGVVMGLFVGLALGREGGAGELVGELDFRDGQLAAAFEGVD